MSAPVYNQQLAALEHFRDAVWGNKHIFTKTVTRHQSETNLRIVEYLDFSKHEGAVHSICSTMEEEKLLVIQEYREAMSNFRIDSPKYKKGKSHFILYAVVELLRERQPVAIQVTWNENQRSQYILLSENGVYHYDHTAVDPLTSHPGIWAFSDSNEYVLAPTVAFTKTLGVRTFQTTFPDRKRYKEWTKETGVRLYFMDLWSTEEIKDLAFIFRLDTNHISKLAEKWGPVPRALLRSCSTPEEQTAYQNAIKNTCTIATQEPNIVMHAITSFNAPLDLGLSNVLFIKPGGKDIIHRSYYSVFVPTCWIQSQLGKQLILEADEPGTQAVGM
ncbi:hypothetical protein HD554DRAFT_2175595 [Boletus coccyginus]|nr:hypothetical protein HD554DRAFT_2175595 [Boletus coccyginus]